MIQERKIEREQRMKKMLHVFKKLFPSPKSELLYSTDWEFLVAVILSAQCTDKRVNQVTRKLFIDYPQLDSYADARIDVFEKAIFSTGFYRNKAKNIIATAIIIRDEYQGRLPKTMNELITLPGVGRKTANVVLSNLYGIHEGIAIDTHAIRIARKFDLVDKPYSPLSIERDLMKISPKKEWGNLNHYFVLYGRYYVPAHAKEVHDELTDIYPKAAYKLLK